MIDFEASDREDEIRRNRGFGNYTGDECKFCGRLRVMENGNDEIVCEKCGHEQMGNGSMKLKAEMANWSSVVGGGGVLLTNEAGQIIGQVTFLCYTDDLRDHETQERLSRIVCDAINASEARTEGTDL